MLYHARPMNEVADSLDIITVTLEDGTKRQCPTKTTVGHLLKRRLDEHGRRYVGALVNNQVVTLAFVLEVDSNVRFLTFADPFGWRVYRDTAAFLLAKVVGALFPQARFSIDHSQGTGFYCDFDLDGQRGIKPEQVAAIDARLRELVAADEPIERRKIAFATAVETFQEQPKRDKYNLLRFRNPSKVVVYTCDGFMDLSHGPLADSTAALTHFELIPLAPGFVIQFPERGVPPRIPPLRLQPRVLSVLQEQKRWGRNVGVETVGKLNELVAANEIGDFIKIAEAYHEKKIAQLADQIAARQQQTRMILIAGPSSSGKTTFAKRLSVQLRANGITPVTISVDNYFVDREHTPKDAKGNNDYEHIEAIDLPAFNEDLRKLDEGQEIDVPTFNFEVGRREYKGGRLKLAPGQMIILEGIHCLNPRLTGVVPAEHKFRIYISALTQLNIDANNRISTTDNRLVRRMVRDHQFRGHSALTTFTMWPSVRRGEKLWIFPFQEEADVVFNSALDYELAVLKPFAEPLLSEVKPYHAQYAEARRLQEFLESFLVIPADVVPPTSILREFIGKSSFRY